MAEYKVQFEVFEGPLDLLLYLVKKQEVDIYQVNLTQIATEFIKYIELMRELDLEVAGEFVVMSATLMYIKSRELLPREQQAQVEEDDDEEDPRWELIKQLVEYKKFKDAASSLQAREYEQDDVFPRQPGVPTLEPAPSEDKLNVSVFDLISAVSTILKRFQEKKETESGEIFADRWTVSEKIEQIRDFLSNRSQVRFSELFSSAASRTEVVVTFLALLELIRLRQLVASQPEAFSEIEIGSAPAVLPPADPIQEYLDEPVELSSSK